MAHVRTESEKMRLLFIVGIVIAVVVYHFFPLSGAKNSASHVIAAINYHNKAASVGNKPGLIIPESDLRA